MAATQTEAPPEMGARRRKAHTKSRKGCDNCKVRHKKCDETKPSCKQCIAFTVLCTYGSSSIKGSDMLQPSIAGEATFQITILPTPSLHKLLLGTISNPSLSLTTHDIATLDRFQARTLPTLETPHTRGLYRAELLRLAAQHPFLMHISLATTLMHDRHLLASSPSSPLPPPASPAELAHSARGTALFASKLSTRPERLTSPDKDAIWAAATLLGSASLARLDAASPEDAWPLRSSPPRGGRDDGGDGDGDCDLDWLRMYDGKREVWRVAEPARPGSSLRRMGEEVDALREEMLGAAAQSSELEHLPVELCRLLRLGCDSNNSNSESNTTDNNPYHLPAVIIDKLTSLPPTRATSVPAHLSFLHLMPPSFRSLVAAKDPRALLLMACWFAEFSRCGAWYVARRAALECEAACLYLERRHGEIPDLGVILRHPRRRVCARR